MATYGIMHDDGTFEPLQQGGQNYGSRPMNLPPGVYWDAQRGVYTNTTPVSSVPGGRVQRYSGNGYAPRRMNLPSGIYWDAQRGVYTNAPVAAIQGGRVQRGNIPFNITQTAKRSVNNPYVPNMGNYTNYMRNMRDAVDWSYSNVPNITNQAKSPSPYVPDMSNYANYMQNMNNAVNWAGGVNRVPNITNQAKSPPPYVPDMSNYANYMQNMNNAVNWAGGVNRVPQNITNQAKSPAPYVPDMSNYTNYMQNMNNAVNWAGGVNRVPNITNQAKSPPPYVPDMSNYANYMQNMNNAVNWAGGVNSSPSNVSDRSILDTIRNWFSQRGNMTQDEINVKMNQLRDVIGDVDTLGTPVTKNTTVEQRPPLGITPSVTMSRSKLNTTKSDLDPFTYVPFRDVEKVWSDAAEIIASQVASNKGENNYDNTYNDIMTRMQTMIDNSESLEGDNVRFSPGETPEDTVLRAINEIGREFLGENWNYLPEKQIELGLR